MHGEVKLLHVVVGGFEEVGGDHSCRKLESPAVHDQGGRSAFTGEENVAAAFKNG